MYKLMIVDDEQIVLDSVRFIVENYMGNSLATETAHSGREAIEKAETFRPDIVVIDIKMPGISGLDAIAEIKKFHNGALFIVVTAYEKFDFAKEALHLGAIDYISKPITRGKLSAALENAVAIKNEEHRKRASELALKEKLAFIQPALESGFIYSMIFADDHDAETESFKRILEVNINGGFVMTVEFSNAESDAENRLGASLRNHNLYPVMRDVIKECVTCIVGPIMLNRIIAYVPCDCDAPEYERRVGALTTASAIYDKLRSVAPKTVFTVGIGKSYADPACASRSYEESLKAIGYAESGGVFHINDIPLERNFSRKYPENEERVLLRHVEAGDADKCLNVLSQIFEWLRQEYAGDKQEIASRLAELVVLLGRIARDYGVAEAASGRDFLREFLAIDDINVLKAWLGNRVRNICEEIGAIRERKLSGAIVSAREYISRNFMREITLEDVSREVSVSPNYFSKLFKDETGSNFIDYLTALRIDKAKKLLSDSSYVNKEICYQIGYSDPNYFSRIFKKIVGVTPTEYRLARISGGN